MADEELVVSLSVLLRRLLLLQAFLRAVELGAVRKHFQREHEAVALRRNAESGHLDRQVRDLRRFAAGRGQVPDLRRAGSRRQEVDARAVRCPGGSGVVLLAARDSPRGDATVDVLQPEVASAAVGGEIGLAQREDDSLAVGREYGFADARQ